MSRLQQTDADYVTNAISPALIMTLIGSLVYFLIAVFYEGTFQGRLNYIFACFIFAAVLIGRISIEDGKERATLFAVPLALATFVVLNTFAHHPGGLSWLVNLGIIGLVWWCAHKLTWDCTVIDDRQDASGEGLLQVAGLAAPPEADDKSLESENSDLDKPEAVKTVAETNDDAPQSWWDQYVERRRRAHAPGIWVLYFSLAALPMFGFLQWAIPVNDTAARTYSFKLLVVYVASALGLLLTTSFLGLRRYLRQRQLEMPGAMAGTWIGIGAAIIIGVMLFTALLPRPAAESTISQLPFQFTSPSDLRPTRTALLKRDGVEDREPTRPSSPGPVGDSNSSESSSDPPPDSQQPIEGGGKKPNPDRQGGSKRGKDEQGEPEPDDANQQEDGPSDSDEYDKVKPEQRSDDEKPGDSADDPENQDAENQPERQAQEHEADADRERPEQSEQQPGEPSSTSPRPPPPPQWQPPVELASGMTWLTALFKLLFYALLTVIVIYLLWRYYDRVAAALRQMIAELRDLWNRLWGRSPTTHAQQATEAERTAKPPQPFADYVDPFMSGRAGQFTPDQLVTYSFEAFEAWAREHGQSRDAELTPREFATAAAPPDSPLHTEARQLAQLYSQVAYAPGSIAPEQTEPLRGLWHAMQSETAAVS